MFDMRIKQLFFDTKAVTGAVDRAARGVLSRFGAFVRRAAKSSIRKRKRISLPGEPPSSHAGLLKRFIYFGYEPRNKNVVIGPIALSGKGGEAPALLEYGGRTLGKDSKGKMVTKRYSARPFMGPAFIKEKPKLPGLWADSVR